MRELSYIVVCAIGAALCFAPLPWHWQARNVSTLLYLGWVSTACLVSFINALLWAGNVEDKAPVWCDISSRYYVCLNVGIISAGLCIQRRLYKVASMKQVLIDEHSRNKQLTVDLLLGLGLPASMLPLYYVFQPLRYNILEDIGCWPATSPATLAVLAMNAWPVLITATSCVYAVLTIRRFLKARRQFARVLSESETGLNLSRFFRLMALAAMDMACGLPLSLYVLIFGISYADEPWPSWVVIHEHINDVGVSTYEDLRSDSAFRVALGFTRWSIPGCAFMFFMFFGLSGDAIKHYKKIFWRSFSFLGFQSLISKPKGPTVSRIRRLISGTNTIQDDPTVPAPIHSVQSRTGSMDDSDERKRVDNEGIVAGQQIIDLENQSNCKATKQERSV